MKPTTLGTDQIEALEAGPPADQGGHLARKAAWVVPEAEDLGVKDNAEPDQ